jgi:hypothetical protein
MKTELTAGRLCFVDGTLFFGVRRHALLWTTSPSGGFAGGHRRVLPLIMAWTLIWEAG